MVAPPPENNYPPPNPELLAIELDLEAEKLLSLCAIAENVKEFSFFLTKDSPGYDGEDVKDDPSCVPGDELIFKKEGVVAAKDGPTVGRAAVALVKQEILDKLDGDKLKYESKIRGFAIAHALDKSVDPEKKLVADIELKLIRPVTVEVKKKPSAIDFDFKDQSKNKVEFEYEALYDLETVEVVPPAGSPFQLDDHQPEEQTDNRWVGKFVLEAEFPGKIEVALTAKNNRGKSKTVPVEVECKAQAPEIKLKADPKEGRCREGEELTVKVDFKNLHKVAIRLEPEDVFTVDCDLLTESGEIKLTGRKGGDVKLIAVGIIGPKEVKFEELEVTCEVPELDLGHEPGANTPDMQCPVVVHFEYLDKVNLKIEPEGIFELPTDSVDKAGPIMLQAKKEGVAKLTGTGFLRGEQELEREAYIISPIPALAIKLTSEIPAVAFDDKKKEENTFKFTYEATRHVEKVEDPILTGIAPLDAVFKLVKHENEVVKKEKDGSAKLWRGTIELEATGVGQVEIKLVAKSKFGSETFIQQIVTAEAKPAKLKLTPNQKATGPDGIIAIKAEFENVSEVELKTSDPEVFQVEGPTKLTAPGTFKVKAMQPGEVGLTFIAYQGEGFAKEAALEKAIQVKCAALPLWFDITEAPVELKFDFQDKEKNRITVEYEAKNFVEEVSLALPPDGNFNLVEHTRSVETPEKWVGKVVLEALDTGEQDMSLSALSRFGENIEKVLQIKAEAGPSAMNLDPSALVGEPRKDIEVTVDFENIERIQLSVDDPSFALKGGMTVTEPGTKAILTGQHPGKAKLLAVGYIGQREVAREWIEVECKAPGLEIEADAPKALDFDFKDPKGNEFEIPYKVLNFVQNVAVSVGDGVFELISHDQPSKTEDKFEGTIKLRATRPGKGSVSIQAWSLFAGAKKDRKLALESKAKPPVLKVSADKEAVKIGEEISLEVEFDHLSEVRLTPKPWGVLDLAKGDQVLPDPGTKTIKLKALEAGSVTITVAGTVVGDPAAEEKVELKVLTPQVKLKPDKKEIELDESVTVNVWVDAIDEVKLRVAPAANFELDKQQLTATGDVKLTSKCPGEAKLIAEAFVGGAARVTKVCSVTVLAPRLALKEFGYDG